MSSAGADGVDRVSKLVFIEQGPIGGRVLPVDPGATIGREGCDILLADPEVSRRHAVVREVDSSPAIEDVGSRNGTFVNGERIVGVRKLGRGDTIRFGNTLWRIDTLSGARDQPQPQRTGHELR